MNEKIEQIVRVLERLPIRDMQNIGGELDKLRLREAARAMIGAMREPTAEMLMAAAPFPLHLVVERADEDYTKNMETATTVDRLAARSKYQAMIDEVLR